MRPLAVTLGDIRQEHIDLKRKIEDRVADMPDGLSCHQVCEILAREMPGLLHIKGTFDGFDHSWLEIPEDRVLFDPYPWASGPGCLVVTLVALTPWSRLYDGVPVQEVPGAIAQV